MYCELAVNLAYIRSHKAINCYEHDGYGAISVGVPGRVLG